jgi:hypothetical protein
VFEIAQKAAKKKVAKKKVVRKTSARKPSSSFNKVQDNAHEI